MAKSDSPIGAHAAVAEPPERPAEIEAPPAVEPPLEAESIQPAEAIPPERKKIFPPPPPQEPPLSCPVYRRLQAYAFDPSFSASFDTYELNRVTLDVPWENLAPGPTGEYVEVIDFDAPSGCYYPAVDLDNRYLLATDGLSPSTGSPMFHQQMVYGVSMRTIRNFELALGRRVQWSPRMQGRDDSGFVQRLRIHPHALRERNAYYHPGKKALLFGYFPAEPKDPEDTLPGGVTFACLSHDIVAHETTHAVLDGIYRNFNYPTNPDQLAFHEAFADIVALLQHFTIHSVVEFQIRKTRGSLRIHNALLELAQEFGRATGMHSALRNAMGGGLDANGKVDYYALGKTPEVHARGAILVSAVFDAFLNIYAAKTADLRRIASGGTGVLQDGEISPDLVHRFASEASELASQFLLMCIRALDYCPPVDLTFGDYLRALITADRDLVPNDPWGYRVAISESFRKHGIVPPNVPTFGEETLLWSRPESNEADALFQDARDELEQMDQLFHIDPGPGQRPIPVPGARNEIFARTREIRRALHWRLNAYLAKLLPDQREKLGFQIGLDLNGDDPHFEVHSVAVAERQGPDGRMIQQFVLTFVQSHLRKTEEDEIELLSGSTVLLERCDRSVRYIIRQRPTAERFDKNLAFARKQIAEQGVYFSVSPDQRFALIHEGRGFFNE